MIEYENLHNLNAPFEAEFERVFRTFLDKGWYILGEQVAAFENEFAAFCGAKHCIGVASGLDALMLSLKIFDFPAGSEVIVPSNTYIATILSIVNSGLKPVLVEPDLQTYNIDPAKIEAKITAATKAVMVVHLYGKPCNMSPIMDICTKYGLQLIEDCAQSHGAKYCGQMTGTVGTFGAFSFYPTKNLGALGDAGAIVTNDDRLAEKMRALRNYGSEKKYHNKYTGYNSRLDELQAAFLRVKLLHLNEINEHKRRLAQVYFESIVNPEIILPLQDNDYYDVYHVFNIRSQKRDALKSYLLENGVKTEIHYPISPNRQEGYRHIFGNEQFHISEEIHSTTLSLPISFSHTQEDVRTVASLINKFIT
jgi:dTDP-4-amino-4,6-dideoxygalactose transaminase